MGIYLTEIELPGPTPWLYQVMVEHQIYDAFQSVTALTSSQQYDVVQGYKQALTDLAA